MNYERFMNPAISNVPPSGIRKFFDIVQTMPEAISLGVGEPDFVTPYHIRDAAINSILDGETSYTSNWGQLSLRKEIAQYLKDRFALNYDPNEEILVTVGASEAIDLSLRAILSPGDEVLVPEPSYVSYCPNVVFAGGVAVPLPTRAENGFVLTVDAIEKAITPKTKLIILPYPNNPTGAIMRMEELKKIREIAIKYDLMILSDEIYAELTYGEQGHVSIASLPDMYERCVVINGFSKAFAMTGWRMGYLCAPSVLMTLMYKIHQYTIMCAPRQGQVAAEQALRQGRNDNYQDVQTMKQSYNQRRRLMLEGFKKMGLTCYEPLGAFYVFPSIAHTGLSSNEFCERLLMEYQVAGVPGTAFGDCGEGHIRCCYATAIDKLQEALSRMEKFVNSL